MQLGICNNETIKIKSIVLKLQKPLLFLSFLLLQKKENKSKTNAGGGRPHRPTYHPVGQAHTASPRPSSFVTSSSRNTTPKGSRQGAHAHRREGPSSTCTPPYLPPQRPRKPNPSSLPLSCSSRCQSSSLCSFLLYFSWRLGEKQQSAPSEPRRHGASTPVLGTGEEPRCLALPPRHHCRAREGPWSSLCLREARGRRRSPLIPRRLFPAVLNQRRQAPPVSVPFPFSPQVCIFTSIWVPSLSGSPPFRHGRRPAFKSRSVRLRASTHRTHLHAARTLRSRAHTRHPATHACLETPGRAQRVCSRR